MKKKTPPARKGTPKKKAKTPRKKPAPAKKKRTRAKRAKTPVARVAPVRAETLKRAFLAAFRILASVKAAAKAAKIARRTHYVWLKTDPDYNRAFREAIPEAAQAIEDEIAERAMRGVYEPNVFQGRFIYPQEQYVAVEAYGKEPAVMAWRDKPGARPIGMWKKSDALLMFLARGWMPEKYKRTSAVELSGPDGGPIEIVARLQAARARVAALAAARRSADDSGTN